KVVDSGGKQLEFSIGGVDKNLLVVKLPKPLKPNDKATVTISFAVKLANVSHRLGYMDDVVFLGNFFPILAVYENGKFVECPYYAVGDPFYSSVANFSVTLKCPSSYVVGASGKPSKVVDGGDFVSTTYSVENARDFALTLSKNYRVIKGVVDGIELTYLYKKDSSPNDSFMTASQAIRSFNKLFGKYPYPTLTVSETPFSDGGMEYPAHVFISDCLSKDERTEVVVHEIAHEWWYGVVGNNQLDFAVFDEGLAQ
ncbi:MAG: M1 family peptidase, partial [Clostridia bacterium]